MLGNIVLFRVVYLILIDISSLVKFLFLFPQIVKDSSVFCLVVRECISQDLGSVYPQGIVTSPRD